MISLIKEVGRGKRGARDLTYDEAKQAACYILDGKATPAQIGAFLVAERIKMESIEEIQAFIDSYREHSFRHPIPESLDCAGPYDGRTRTFIATLPSAFVLAACGVNVTIHGSPSLPPKWGVTLTDVLNELGIHPNQLSNETLTSAADETGLLFIPTERWCPPLAQIRQLRQEIGLRTVFNSVEKMLRLSDAQYMAAGVFHGTVFEKIASLVAELGVKRGIIIQGMEGSEDLSVDKRTRTYLVKEGASELFIVDPEHYELQVEVPDQQWTATQQAVVCKQVLQGQAELPYLNMVLLNSAVRLWITQKAGSIEEGIYLSRHMLDNGSAWNLYQRWAASLTANCPS
jgi:anthranilate phosphoribosyltransferase